LDDSEVKSPKSAGGFLGRKVEKSKRQASSNVVLNIKKSIIHSSWIWFKPLAATCNSFADNLNGILTSLRGLTKRTREDYEALRHEVVEKEKKLDESRRRFAKRVMEYEKEQKKNKGPSQRPRARMEETRSTMVNDERALANLQERVLASIVSSICNLLKLLNSFQALTSKFTSDQGPAFGNLTSGALDFVQQMVAGEDLRDLVGAYAQSYTQSPIRDGDRLGLHSTGALYPDSEEESSSIRHGPNLPPQIQLEDNVGGTPYTSLTEGSMPQHELYYPQHRPPTLEESSSHLAASTSESQERLSLSSPVSFRKLSKEPPANTYAPSSVTNGQDDFKSRNSVQPRKAPPIVPYDISNFSLHLQSSPKADQSSCDHSVFTVSK